MEPANMHKSINRTFVVIEGGIHKKADARTFPPTSKPRLLEQVRQAIRTRHYSYRTEKAYVHWIKRPSSSITNAIRKKWAKLKLPGSFPVWRRIPGSAPPHRTKR